MTRQPGREARHEEGPERVRWTPIGLTRGDRRLLFAGTFAVLSLGLAAVLPIDTGAERWWYRVVFTVLLLGPVWRLGRMAARRPRNASRQEVLMTAGQLLLVVMAFAAVETRSPWVFLAAMAVALVGCVWMLIDNQRDMREMRAAGERMRELEVSILAEAMHTELMCVRCRNAPRWGNQRGCESCVDICHEAGADHACPICVKDYP